MPAMNCVCGYHLEGADDEELFRNTRAHADEAHADLQLTDQHIRDFLAAGARAAPPRPRLTQISTPVIRALTPDLLADYLRFFDRDAFADNPAWASCYCRYYHFPGPEDEWRHCSAAENRAAVSELIRAGKAHGYLAYVDDQPAGWCHAAPRTELPHFDRFAQFRTEDPERVGAIVCFVIAPPYRRHGLARRLLDAACEGFRRRGLAFAEAYPAQEPESEAAAYHGPLPMYRAAGFSPYRELDRYVIVRKPLLTPEGS